MSKQYPTISIISMIALVLALVGAGCRQVQKSEEQREGKPYKVAATIYPLYDLTRQVAGDYADVVLILPPAASPHTFDPQPSLVKDLQRAKLVFTIGHGLDTWAEGLIKNIDGAKQMTVGKDIQLRETGEEPRGDEKTMHEEEDEDDPDHGPIDPHYWMNPMNGAIIAHTIAEALGTIDPTHKIEYVARAEGIRKQIEAKDIEWQRAVRGLSRKEIITFHDAFYYFADHFNFDVVATFEPSPGKEPSPQYLRSIVQTVREHQLTHVFVEPQLPQASLRAFAEDYGLTVGVLDDTGGVAGREDYISLIDYNVQTLVQSLQ